MIQILAAGLILYFSLKLVKLAARTPPQTFARMLRAARGQKGRTAMSNGLLSFLSRSGAIGATLSALGAWWLHNRKPDGEGFSAAGAGRTAHVKQARSKFLEMELDLDTGAMRGAFVAGPLAGRRLADLPRESLVAQLDGPPGADADSRALLEAYLDRLFPGWRVAGQAQADAGSAGDEGPMTEELAYKLLGLGQGATRDDVARAHRALMKKVHPDYGGTAHEAARINEARDLLMRRHG